LHTGNLKKAGQRFIDVSDMMKKLKYAARQLSALILINDIGATGIQLNTVNLCLYKNFSGVVKDLK
jgi:hypothetical protein